MGATLECIGAKATSVRAIVTLFLALTLCLALLVSTGAAAPTFNALFMAGD